MPVESAVNLEEAQETTLAGMSRFSTKVFTFMPDGLPSAPKPEKGANLAEL